MLLCLHKTPIPHGYPYAMASSYLYGPLTVTPSANNLMGQYIGECIAKLKGKESFEATTYVHKYLIVCLVMSRKLFIALTN